MWTKIILVAVLAVVFANQTRGEAAPTPNTGSHHFQENGGGNHAHGQDQSKQNDKIIAKTMSEAKIDFQNEERLRSNDQSMSHIHNEKTMSHVASQAKASAKFRILNSKNEDESSDDQSFQSTIHSKSGNTGSTTLTSEPQYSQGNGKEIKFRKQVRKMPHRFLKDELFELIDKEGKIFKIIEDIESNSDEREKTESSDSQPHIRRTYYRNPRGSKSDSKVESYDKNINTDNNYDDDYDKTDDHDINDVDDGDDYDNKFSEEHSNEDENKNDDEKSSNVSNSVNSQLKPETKSTIYNSANASSSFTTVGSSSNSKLKTTASVKSLTQDKDDGSDDKISGNDGSNDGSDASSDSGPFSLSQSSQTGNSATATATASVSATSSSTSPSSSSSHTIPFGSNNKWLSSLIKIVEGSFGGKFYSSNWTGIAKQVIPLIPMGFVALITHITTFTNYWPVIVQGISKSWNQLMQNPKFSDIVAAFSAMVITLACVINTHWGYLWKWIPDWVIAQIPWATIAADVYKYLPNAKIAKNMLLIK